MRQRRWHWHYAVTLGAGRRPTVDVRLAARAVSAGPTAPRRLPCTRGYGPHSRSRRQQLHFRSRELLIRQKALGLHLGQAAQLRREALRCHSCHSHRHGGCRRRARGSGSRSPSDGRRGVPGIEYDGLRHRAGSESTLTQLLPRAYYAACTCVESSVHPCEIRFRGSAKLGSGGVEQSH